MKILDENYKRNTTAFLVATIIIFPAANVLKEAYALAVISFMAQGVLTYVTNLFSWQRKTIKWYGYYFYGVQLLFCVVALAIYEEWVDKFNGVFWGALPLVLGVYCVELFLAIEKEKST